ncbi:MAG TPA: SDR family oxidoreductase [Polyangiaceae bacterium]|nr:SDR family oxidoreductase [Polyangiaceae bacterium]
MADYAVVTGAGGALGGAVVRALAARGRRVAAVDLVTAEEGLRAVAAASGEACVPFLIDVRSRGSWAGVFERMGAGGGRLLGAALVAGGWTGGGPFHARPSDWRAMAEKNVDTAMGSLQAVLSVMVEQRAGSVVVVGARAAAEPATSAGAAAYAASKAAVVALSQAVAAEVGPYGVRVNAVLPSTLDTPANRAAMPGVDPARWVDTRALADVILFLLSDESRAVRGAAIPVYGAG